MEATKRYENFVNNVRSKELSFQTWVSPVNETQISVKNFYCEFSFHTATNLYWFYESDFYEWILLEIFLKNRLYSFGEQQAIVHVRKKALWLHFSAW